MIVTSWWMSKILDLAGGTTLTSALSNVSSSGYRLPNSSRQGFSYGSGAYVYNSGSTTCSASQACYSYYSYTAACAGDNPSSGTCSYDICPKGWRLPIKEEFDSLAGIYLNGDNLTNSTFYADYGVTYTDGYRFDTN